MGSRGWSELRDDGCEGGGGVRGGRVKGVVGIKGVVGVRG